jgi:hypothetical protein
LTLLVLNRRGISELIPGWLGELSGDLVLVTARSALARSTPTAALAGYREVIVVDDYDGPDVDDLIVQVGRRHGVQRILSCAEVDVVRAARAREALGLPGQDLVSAHAFRDKYTMKTTLASAGIPVAPMSLVHTADDLRRFAGDHGLPIVVKPRDGGASVGVQVLRDEAAVGRRADSLPDGGPGLLAEAWIEGDFFTIDGLMARGEVLQIWPSWTSPNLATVAEGRPLLSWMLVDTDRRKRPIERLVAEAIRALPGPAEVTAFHAEVFHTPADRFILCEIACRPGGCGHVTVYERALGVNLYQATLRGQAASPEPPLNNTASPLGMGGFVWFPPLQGVLRAVPANCPLPGAYDYLASGVVGRRYEKVRAVSNHIARCFVAGRTDEDLEAKVRAIGRWWGQESAWSH